MLLSGSYRFNAAVRFHATVNNQNVLSPPVVVPSWMLAVLLGVWFSFKFHNLKQHVWAYSVTYLMYALMITSGLVVHSLFLEECDAERRSNVPNLILIV